MTVLSVLCYTAGAFCALFVFVGAWPMLIFTAFFIFIGMFAYKHRFDKRGGDPAVSRTPVDGSTVQRKSPDMIPAPAESHVAGTVEYLVYNYNEPVVANIPRGRIFTAEIIRRRMNVPFHGNRDLGYVLGGGNGNGYVLSYNGAPFGVIPNDLTNYPNGLTLSIWLIKKSSQNRWQIKLQSHWKPRSAPLSGFLTNQGHPM